MELHQLRYLLAVVDEGSFTAAAARLHVAQSGVSSQVAKLERELGLTLIDRSSRRLDVTPSGERIVVAARTALAAVAAVTETAAEIRGLVVGQLRVGTVTGLTWTALFDALATLHEQHPGIDIRLAEGSSADLITRVRTGESDLAVAAWSGRAPTDLQCHVVVDDALVAVVGQQHPWSRRRRLSIAELVQAPLICLPEGTAARTALEDLAVRAGYSVEPRWEVATPAFAQQLTARGLGVAVVSETTASDWPDSVILPLADRAARSVLGVLYRPDPSVATTALLALLTAATAQ